MHRFRTLTGTVAVLSMLLIGACDTVDVQSGQTEADAPVVAAKGQITVNGWYEGEEIYYIDRGVEDGVTERGENDLYIIGGVPRLYQPHVVEFIPGEAGYSPHWNVHLVHTADGVTRDDIVASPFVSDMWWSDAVLFDDVADILGAVDAGLVTLQTPGVVVNCPIISTPGSEAPGHTQASEEFEMIPDTF